ncbi:MAG: CPBP family intramembrane metalloprotease [Clostridia bacterium]|nr:CPBP family intramembrane metalloprotease [Clostridia bacterium]
METILLALILQLILFQLSSFLPLAVRCIFPNASPAFTDNASETIGIAAYVAIFCIPAYIIGKYAVDSPVVQGHLFSCKLTLPKNAVSVAFTALGGIILIGYVSYIFRIGLELSGIGIHGLPIDIPDDKLGTVLIFFSSVLVPAIVEEILYRGVLLHTLLPYGQTFAIIISSAAFSIMHCNPTQFLYAFFGGFIFSHVAIKSGSIFYCMILHFANNLISFLSLVISKHIPEELASSVLMYVDAFFIIMGIASFIYLTLKGFFDIDKDIEKKDLALSPYKSMLSMYTLIYVFYAIYLTLRWFYII